MTSQPKLIRAPLLAFATIPFLFACSEPVVSYPPFPAVIYGKVTTASGEPVHAARLHVLGYRDNCTSGLAWNDHTASYFTRDDGTFDISAPTMGAQHDLCFNIEVIPPPGSSLASTTAGPFQTHPRSDPFDSAYDPTEVNIVLR